MTLNDEAIKKLREECEIPEKGKSAYWTEMLQGFDEKDGKFVSKGLPEGEGGDDCNPIKELIHWLLQSPFRWQGNQFPEFRNILRTAAMIHKRRNNKMRMGTLRQVISLACLERHVRISRLAEPIVIIGDGFGLMSSLILQHFDPLKSKIVVVNLTQNLLLDAVFIKKSVPNAPFVLVKCETEYKKALDDDGIQCVLIQADNAQLISQGSIGLVINICSMQEMSLESIQEYFDFIRRSKNSRTFFYCANRCEKRLPDGTIVNFFKYPWHPKDEILFDELCPWQQKYYSYRPPFYFPYDGPKQHRLVLMHK